MAIGAVILAAGSATRMGKVKQLLPFAGGTFLTLAIQRALEAGFAPVVVVLGANAAEIRARIEGEMPANANWQVVVNQDWETGMGSSLAAGVKKVCDVAPGCEGIAVLLTDQPRVTGRHLAELANAFQTSEASIVAAEYKGLAGVPAIFGRAFFVALMNLPPDAGARHLLRSAGAEIDRYSLPEAAMDVDTPEDFARLGLPT